MRKHAFLFVVLALIAVLGAGCATSGAIGRPGGQVSADEFAETVRKNAERQRAERAEEGILGGLFKRVSGTAADIVGGALGADVINRIR